MSTPSAEIVRLTEEYFRASTEKEKEEAFQRLRDQREKEAIEALRSVAVIDQTYTHECPKCFVKRTK